MSYPTYPLWRSDTIRPCPARPCLCPVRAQSRPCSCPVCARAHARARAESVPVPVPSPCPCSCPCPCLVRAQCVPNSCLVPARARAQSVPSPPFPKPCHRLSICDGGFGGWGRERPVKQWATSVSLWRGLDHHGFRTGQVYKPGPDLHKTLQPFEGKEWRSNRIPLPPHQRRI